MGRSALQALAKKRKPAKQSDAHFFNEDLDWLMEQGPEVSQAAKRDLDQLSEDPQVHGPGRDLRWDPPGGILLGEALLLKHPA
eukprot:Skav205672  [mRNA]  locus=scaffold458:666555:671019:+ [translate_table: standard]